MDYICRICSESKTERSFTERSQSMHTCKSCSKILHHLKSEEHKLLDEIFGILVQSRISKADSVRLETLTASIYPKCSLHATLVF